MDLRSPFTFVPDEGAGPRATIRGEQGGGAALSGASSRLEAAYRIGRTLGTGGTAVVRVAHQVSLDRPVALKTPLAADSLDRVTRVLQEAWVTGALEHPGVVPVHDVAVDEAGVPHIVMRRIDGWTWTELLADPGLVATRFGVRDVLAWHLRTLMSVAATVHHAHGRGVLHRDLKPDNVMIGPSGEAYVLDWGLAVALGEEAARYLPRATEQWGLAGTPRFMAPEMLRPGALGVRTDVYLLGGLLHAVLTGDGPHAGEDVEQTLAAIPRFVPRFPEGTPARLAALCAATLDPRPEARPESAEAFRRGVQAWLEDRDTEALTAAGDRELAALRDAVGTEAPAETVVRRFAAARVAYEQALARPGGAEEAARGLAAARTAMVAWELDRGDPHAAERVLAEMAAPPPELEARVRRAREEADARAAAAARLLADADPGAGVRTRAFLTIVSGVVFAAAPLAAWRFDPDPTYGRLLAAHAALLALLAALWFWARDSLGKSTLNRGFIRSLAAGPVVQATLLVGAASLGLSPAQATALLPFTLGGMCAVSAALGHPWLAVPTVGYLAAWLVAAAEPAARWPALAAANLVLSGAALAVWGPEGLRSWMAFRALKRARREAARADARAGGPRVGG